MIDNFLKVLFLWVKSCGFKQRFVNQWAKFGVRLGEEVTSKQLGRVLLFADLFGQVRGNEYLVNEHLDVRNQVVELVSLPNHGDQHQLNLTRILT